MTPVRDDRCISGHADWTRSCPRDRTRERTGHQAAGEPQAAARQLSHRQQRSGKAHRPIYKISVYPAIRGRAQPRSRTKLKVRSVSTFALIVAVPSIVLLSSSPFDCCAQVYQRLTWSGAMAAQSRKIAREFVSRLMSRAKCGR